MNDVPHLPGIPVLAEELRERLNSEHEPTGQEDLQLQARVLLIRRRRQLRDLGQKCVLEPEPPTDPDYGRSR
jgi:hypothetical protein